MHLAIDYGAKFAGTTVLCWAVNDQLHFAQSTKKQDADIFLKKYIAELKPDTVFMDAPLSLPGVYSGDGADYFYRQCDREVGAMSPMFLGGLTARAMQLRAIFSEILFYETYPAQLRRTVLPEAIFYKKEKLGIFCELLKNILPFPFVVQPANWHQVDATLAWLSGWRFINGEVQIYGDKKEGTIVV